MIQLGVSGWYYDDWVGPVYPEDLDKKDWLPFVAELVDTIELNVTYYRIPSPSMSQGWVARTPDDFTFAVKAHQSITHEREDPDCSGFLEGIQPLIEAEKMACILAQFPYSFHNTQPNRDYLIQLRDCFAGQPVAVEFRNRGWVKDETFDLLEELEFGTVGVDEPRFKNLMPPLVKATGPVSYVRFHGRNAKKWWHHEHAWERYDYTYSDEELSEWIPRLKALEAASVLTLVYANNHYKGQSLDAVRKLGRLLAAADGDS
ncbi:MAG: DUF72 domain-containing protein [Anaerolineales bacterium]|jgi:uncharacterized protein YecE (DUF72 family)